MDEYISKSSQSPASKLLHNGNHRPIVPSSTVAGPSRTTRDFVDLTLLSSSDEEEAPPSRAQTKQRGGPGLHQTMGQPSIGADMPRPSAVAAGKRPEPAVKAVARITGAHDRGPGTAGPSRTTVVHRTATQRDPYMPAFMVKDRVQTVEGKAAKTKTAARSNISMSQTSYGILPHTAIGKSAITAISVSSSSSTSARSDHQGALAMRSPGLGTKHGTAERKRMPPSSTKERVGFGSHVKRPRLLELSRESTAAAAAAAAAAPLASHLAGRTFGRTPSKEDVIGVKAGFGTTPKGLTRTDKEEARLAAAQKRDADLQRWLQEYNTGGLSRAVRRKSSSRTSTPMVRTKSDDAKAGLSSVLKQVASVTPTQATPTRSRIRLDESDRTEGSNDSVRSAARYPPPAHPLGYRSSKPKSKSTETITVAQFTQILTGRPPVDYPPSPPGEAHRREITQEEESEEPRKGKERRPDSEGEQADESGAVRLVSPRSSQLFRTASPSPPEKRSLLQRERKRILQPSSTQQHSSSTAAPARSGTAEKQTASSSSTQHGGGGVKRKRSTNSAVAVDDQGYAPPSSYRSKEKKSQQRQQLSERPARARPEAGKYTVPAFDAPDDMWVSDPKKPRGMKTSKSERTKSAAAGQSQPTQAALPVVPQPPPCSPTPPMPMSSLTPLPSIPSIAATPITPARKAKRTSTSEDGSSGAPKAVPSSAGAADVLVESVAIEDTDVDEVAETTGAATPIQEEEEDEEEEDLLAMYADYAVPLSPPPIATLPGPTAPGSPSTPRKRHIAEMRQRLLATPGQVHTRRTISPELPKTPRTGSMVLAQNRAARTSVRRHRARSIHRDLNPSGVQRRLNFRPQTVSQILPRTSRGHDRDRLREETAKQEEDEEVKRLNQEFRAEMARRRKDAVLRRAREDAERDRLRREKERREADERYAAWERKEQEGYMLREGEERDEDMNAELGLGEKEKESEEEGQSLATTLKHIIKQPKPPSTLDIRRSSRRSTSATGARPVPSGTGEEVPADAAQAPLDAKRAAADRKASRQFAKLIADHEREAKLDAAVNLDITPHVNGTATEAEVVPYPTPLSRDVSAEAQAKSRRGSGEAGLEVDLDALKGLTGDVDLAALRGMREASEVEATEEVWEGVWDWAAAAAAAAKRQEGCVGEVKVVPAEILEGQIGLGIKAAMMGDLSLLAATLQNCLWDLPMETADAIAEYLLPQCWEGTDKAGYALDILRDTITALPYLPFTYDFPARLLQHLHHLGLRREYLPAWAIAHTPPETERFEAPTHSESVVVALRLFEVLPRFLSEGARAAEMVVLLALLYADPASGEGCKAMIGRIVPRMVEMALRKSAIVDLAQTIYESVKSVPVAAQRGVLDGLSRCPDLARLVALEMLRPGCLKALMDRSSTFAPCEMAEDAAWEIYDDIDQKRLDNFALKHRIHMLFLVMGDLEAMVHSVPVVDEGERDGEEGDPVGMMLSTIRKAEQKIPLGIPNQSIHEVHNRLLLSQLHKILHLQVSLLRTRRRATLLAEKRERIRRERKGLEVAEGDVEAGRRGGQMRLSFAPAPASASVSEPAVRGEV